MGDVSLAVDRVRPSLIKRNSNEAIVGLLSCLSFLFCGLFTVRLWKIIFLKVKILSSWKLILKSIS